MIKKQSAKVSKKFGSVKKKFFALAIMMAVFSSLFVGYTNVHADPDPAGSNTTTTTGGSGSSTGNCQTGILPQSWCDQGIEQMIKDVAGILTALIFIAGTGFIVYSGFIWATAGDNPSRVATAKKRIVEIVIGLVFFMLINVLIQFLIGN